MRIMLCFALIAVIKVVSLFQVTFLKMRYFRRVS